MKRLSRKDMSYEGKGCNVPKMYCIGNFPILMVAGDEFSSNNEANNEH